LCNYYKRSATAGAICVVVQEHVSGHAIYASM
jgi:hypothetical protein